MKQEPRSYDSPEAFRQALEDRLKASAAKARMTVNRVRQTLVFERFLARVHTQLGQAAIAKGGVALELRLARARTTRDVDFRVSGSPDDILESLQRAGRLDLGDHLRFTVGVVPGGETMEGDGIIYEGLRFKAEGRLAGRVYGDPFGVDVAFGDILTGEVEELSGSDLLSFAGVQPARIRVYPRETHLAEKLHAYTLPRERSNTRVKDLPDMALLGTTGPFDAALLRQALDATFTFRASHPLPRNVPAPPPAWASPYARMAGQNALPWTTLADVYEAMRSFVDPLLEGQSGQWDPDVWRWIS